MKLRIAFLLVALLMTSTFVSAQTPAAAKPVVPTWYAPNDTVLGTLTGALAAANDTHRRMSVMYEGDWCSLCQEVHSMVENNLDLPHLLTGFAGVPVTVDFEGLQKFADTIHTKLTKENSLLITVLNFDGSVLTTITAPRLLDAGHLSVAKFNAIMMEFFPGASAEQVLQRSLRGLGADSKLGWVEFRADWCGWCKKMEKFFQESEAAPILAKYYSVIAVDTEKNEGAEKLSRRLGSVNGVDGIPWFAVVDAGGKVLATSEGPKGNIGFPDTDVEVAHFFSMLKSTAKGITPGEIETIRKALKPGDKVPTILVPGAK